MKKIIVDEKTYKRAKKKKCIYVSHENYIKNIDKKVIISNGNKGKKVKIKKTYEAENLELLKAKLGSKFKYVTSNIEKSDDKVYGIEFKSSLKLFRKIILFILILGLLYVCKINIDKYNNKKLLNNLQKTKQEEISYVIVEINPKLLLELKGNQINNFTCLNEDCKNVFNTIDIKDKDINEAIEILYNTAIDKGIDVSNGVKIFSQNEKIKEKVNSISYVIYEKINEETENKYKEEIIDETEKMNFNNEKSYNEKLLEIYKKDKEYGKNYTCNINDGNLECYITDRLFKKVGQNVDLTTLLEILDGYQELMKVCDKFDIPYKSSGVEGGELLGIDKVYLSSMYISDSYRTVNNFSYNDNECNGCISISNGNMADASLNGDHYYVLPLNKLNLVNGTYKEEDVQMLDDDSEGESMTGEPARELTDEEIQKEYERFYGNSNN